MVVVAYEDFLCPFCRRLWKVYQRLRRTLGDRLVYVFRHFPNEHAHPGAELAARASEAAARQGIAPGLHVFSNADVRRRIDEGWTFVAANSELKFMVQGAVEVARLFHPADSASAAEVAKY